MSETTTTTSALRSTVSMTPRSRLPGHRRVLTRACFGPRALRARRLVMRGRLRVFESRVPVGAGVPYGHETANVPDGHGRSRRGGPGGALDPSLASGVVRGVPGRDRVGPAPRRP